MMNLSKLLLMSVLSLVTISIAEAGWLKRIEAALPKGKVYGVFEAGIDANLSFSNEYGNIQVVIVPDSRRAFYITGNYSSDSPRHATLQYLVKKNNRFDLFVDGPALFKSHDHVATYGKSLDFAFFEKNVGKIPHIERGENAGEIAVGPLTLRSGSFSMGPRTTIWGPASFGRELKIYEGMSIGKEPATADLVFAVPIQLIGQLDLKVDEGHTIDITFTGGMPHNYKVHRDPQDPTRATIVRTDRPCADAVAE